MTPTNPSFELPDNGEPLCELVAQRGFEFVHFFAREGVEHSDVTAQTPAPATARYSLVDLGVCEELGDAAVAAISAAGDPATMRDLLLFARANPNIQTSVNVLATGTMRAREKGRTVWGTLEAHKPTCQWIPGISEFDGQSALYMFELYLSGLFVRPVHVLVRER